MAAWSTLALVSVAPLAIACTQRSTYNLDGGDIITVGQLYVSVEKCASCHQTANSKAILGGDDAVTPNSLAYGENLTPDVQTGLGGWADVQIVRAMRFGLDTLDQPLCPAMPMYPDMTDLEANAIVAYLRSLPLVSHAVPDSVCPPIRPRQIDDMLLPDTDLGKDGG